MQHFANSVCAPHIQWIVHISSSCIMWNISCVAQLLLIFILCIYSDVDTHNLYINNIPTLFICQESIIYMYDYVCNKQFSLYIMSSVIYACIPVPLYITYVKVDIEWCTVIHYIWSRIEIYLKKNKKKYIK